MGTTTAMSARSLQYYVIASRWASDLEFFELETTFFYRLINDYLIRWGGPVNAEGFKQVYNNLLKLEAEKNKAERLLKRQLKHLELMAEDIIPEDVDSLSDKQIQLEYLITDLVNEYKNVKKTLFALVETARKIKGG